MYDAKIFQWKIIGRWRDNLLKHHAITTSKDDIVHLNKNIISDGRNMLDEQGAIMFKFEESHGEEKSLEYIVPGTIDYFRP